ncbi:MAG: GFA family protein [Proteobacteria bacterium]|nr:GFA family protein [Pseudomonadota bacterium]
MAGDSKLKGGCLCGAVRYELAAEPVMTGICHCLNCQKLSGSGHAFHIMVPEAAFSVCGTTKGYTWAADSGSKVTTSFCGECGSPMFGRTGSFPGMVTVRAASLDDPTAVKPQVRVFAKRQQPWDHADPALPAFPTMPPAENRA